MWGMLHLIPRTCARTNFEALLSQCVISRLRSGLRCAGSGQEGLCLHRGRAGQWTASAARQRGGGPGAALRGAQHHGAGAHGAAHRGVGAAGPRGAHHHAFKPQILSRVLVRHWLAVFSIREETAFSTVHLLWRCFCRRERTQQSVRTDTTGRRYDWVLPTWLLFS